MKLKLRGWVYYGIFFVGLILLFLATYGVLRTQSANYKRAESYKDKLEKDKKNIEIQIIGADRMLQFSKSDQFYERKARESFGYVMDDEIIFIDEATSASIPMNEALEAINKEYETIQGGQELDGQSEPDSSEGLETAVNQASQTENFDENIGENIGENTGEVQNTNPQPNPQPEIENAQTDHSSEWDDIAEQFNIPDENE